MIRFKPHCGQYDPSKDLYVETIEDFWNIEFIQSFKNMPWFHMYAYSTDKYSTDKDYRFMLMSLSNYDTDNNKCNHFWAVGYVYGINPTHLGLQDYKSLINRKK